MLKIYSREGKEEDRVGERIILIGLVKRDNFDIDHVSQKYELNEEYVKISKSMTE